MAITLSQRFSPLARVLTWSCLGIAIIALLFRATVYTCLPVTVGDAYSFSDFLELALGGLLLVCALASLVVGGALVAATPWKLLSVGSVTFIVGAAMPVMYLLLHPYFAQVAWSCARHA